MAHTKSVKLSFFIMFIFKVIIQLIIINFPQMY